MITGAMMFSASFGFGARAAFLRLCTSNGFGRLLLSSLEDPPGNGAQVRFEIFKAHGCELLALGWLRHGRTSNPEKKFPRFIWPWLQILWVQDGGRISHYAKQSCYVELRQT
jgi:hypothetical protein